MDIKDQCQEVLNKVMIDEQIEVLNIMMAALRKQKNASRRAEYMRSRYRTDAEFRKKHNDNTNKVNMEKYSTDSEWRAKVRNQQREYYHRCKQEKAEAARYTRDVTC